MSKLNVFRYLITTLFSLTVLMMQTLVHAETVSIERIEWQKIPIDLQLIVGEEQQITFPVAVKVGVPGLVQPLVRTQSVNGTVYLLANAPFDSSRFMVRELESGRIYLFDVTATNVGVASGPIEIYTTHHSSTAKAVANGNDRSDQAQPSYIQLTRFAAKQLYAPSRLVDGQRGLVRVPVANGPFNLIHGAKIEATPLVGWRGYGLYVTAVKLTNRTLQAQILDPRDLRGVWLTATFQHHRLLPKGDEADTTAVYLVSARPFDVSR